MAHRKDFFNKNGSKAVTRKARFNPENGWNDQFENTFAFATNGIGHGCIQAVAGAGKTTALTEITYRVKTESPTKKLLAVAFNKSIATELNTRLADNTKSATTHALGFSIVRARWEARYGKNFDVQNATGPRMMTLVGSLVGQDDEKKKVSFELCKAISMAKTTLAETQEDVINIIQRFGYDTCDLNDAQFADVVLKALDMCTKGPGTGQKSIRRGKSWEKIQVPAITFDDMVWLPVVNKWSANEKFDMVLVDECQDISAARFALVRKHLKDDNSRIIMVGDPRQAIYGFAGAGAGTIEGLVNELDAKVLPLNVSFRCAKNIINIAKSFNEEIEADDDAANGEVSECELDSLSQLAAKGNAVLSRTNAPLVRQFFKLAKAGVAVTMLGKEFGENIQKKVSRMGESTIEGLAAKVESYYNAQIQMAVERNWSEQYRQQLTDEHDTLTVLIQGAANLDEFQTRLNAIMGDKPSSEKVTLSSVHKAKGLEWNKVFALKDTLKMDDIEEMNIGYVCVTRAKKELVFVNGK